MITAVVFGGATVAEADAEDVLERADPVARGGAAVLPVVDGLAVDTDPFAQLGLRPAAAFASSADEGAGLPFAAAAGGHPLRVQGKARKV